MESFQWNEAFETGLGEVDKQHHHLVDVINRFGELVMRGTSVSKDDFEALFNELASYTKYHFSEEESYMEHAKIDPRHVENHRKEHADFLGDVTLIYKNTSPDTLGAGEPLLKFLIYWLAFHILGSDQSMAMQIKAIEQGKDAAEAYNASKHMWAGPNEQLLKALTGLFHQLSIRNRELSELNQTLENRVKERTAELAIANHRLEEISFTDVLTGLPNRRHAMQQLSMQWEESVRNNTSLSCLMVDADYFKEINDTSGHDAGDKVLRELSKALKYSVRTDDLVCRLGGDEFFIICPNTPLDGALRVAEQTRKAVTSLRIPVEHGEWAGSISVGVATRQSNMSGPDDLIKAADQGVYAAKRKGRNCVATSD
ncbi:MAG: bacteriohemerythrin [Gammaproteobacteria bacterium]|nr:bacteriohemerythrin [Gammaproteobacteria bacterium]MBU1447516.1 bacteriohemerythrin [Gammaproteobacteria bacterium]